MATFSADRIERLLLPYLQQAEVSPPDALFTQLSTYLDLLLKWNARINLTAIRDPETIVTRHFGESLFLAAHLSRDTRTVLDLGSGAGFPGLPLHLLRPDLTVTLAESQHKKSAFLAEVVRSLTLTTLVHASRAEDLVGKARFDTVALRAVDNMEHAVRLSTQLSAHLLILTTAAEADRWEITHKRVPVPHSRSGILAIIEP